MVNIDLGLSVHQPVCVSLFYLPSFLNYIAFTHFTFNLAFILIRPVLENGDIVCDNCSDQSCKLLEDVHVQIEAGRNITGIRCNSSRSRLFEELGWEPLSERRKNFQLVLFCKIIIRYAPR